MRLLSPTSISSEMLQSCIPSSEKGMDLSLCTEKLNAKLSSGCRLFVLESDGELCAKSLVCNPGNSIFKIKGDGVWTIHCLTVTPDKDYETHALELVKRIEAELSETAKAIGAVVYHKGRMNNSELFRRHGYEYAARDTIASVVIKRFEPKASLEYIPSYPKLSMLDGKVRVQINYDPYCPATFVTFKRAAEEIRALNNPRVELSEAVIDDTNSYAVYGFPGVYVNRIALPAGPLEWSEVREVIQNYLTSKLPITPAG
ncbi:MAG: hypothetical protein Kow00107_11010 [Planctomycetota bacterium]